MKAVVVMSAVLLVGSTAYAQGVDDAQIASIVVTANQVDIDAGKLASSMAANARRQEVRRADGDRSHRRQQTGDRAGDEAEGHAARTTRPAQSLKSGGAENVANLKKLKGAAFDKAYVDHEVAYHQQVIDALDKTLIPNASNAELKALLVKVRPAFVAHLEHAKHVQSSLK